MFEFDPNTFTEPVLRVYGDPRCEVYAIVDREDYAWATQWKWKIKVSRGRSAKQYLCRNSGRGSDSWTIYLHIEIMKRKQPVPPDFFHTWVDHFDGDSLNCRRYNLEWTTPSKNRRNQRAKPR